jgi:hypothetical protein
VDAVDAPVVKAARPKLRARVRVRPRTRTTPMTTKSSSRVWSGQVAAGSRRSSSPRAKVISNRRKPCSMPARRSTRRASTAGRRC